MFGSFSYLIVTAGPTLASAESADIDADLTLEQMREVNTLIAKNRRSAAPFDIIQFGTTAG